MELRYALSISLVLCFASGGRIRREDELNLTPNIFNRQNNNECTYDGKRGICMHESYCNAEHRLEKGGIIDASEFRQKSIGCKNDLFEWCCLTDDIVTPNVTKIEETGCTTLKDDSCPWCVTLYTSSSILSFCLGSMIGTRVILTAGTCAKQAQGQTLWARVPASAQPLRNYTVQFRKFHPQYNTGTHGNDFGLFVLDTDVNWGTQNWKGACLEFQGLNKVKDNCVVMGLDNGDNLISTILAVENGKCPNKGGDSADAACGSTDFGDECSGLTGSPVICGPEGKMSLFGVARTSCFSDDKILLGSLTSAKEWLEDELQKLKITSKIFTSNGLF